VGEFGDDQVLRKAPVRKIRFFAGQGSYLSSASSSLAANSGHG
jgi:hypothetical protein